MIEVPVPVKDALREGCYKKNYRFVVLNDDGTPDAQVGTIDNDYLVSESVSIDERMCSGDTLKFGLCEGSSLEFQYFNKPNITGKRVQAFVDVDYGEDEPYTIPMGFFDVKKCSRQASTGIMKVTAYNKLMSEYLDAKANEILVDTIATNNPVTIFDVRSFLLNDFKITEDRTDLGTIDYPPMSIIDSEYVDLGNFKFTSLYGKKSPINAYEFGITDTNTTFKLTTYADVPYYNLVAKCQIDARYGSLAGLEQNIYNYLKKIINDADLDRDWDDVLDYICTHGGFQRIISIVDGEGIAINSDFYSTIQWDYEEAHNLQHTVVGKITDAQRLTQSSHYYSVVIPVFLQKGYGDPHIRYEGIFERDYITELDYYEYYIDDTLTTTAREPMPFVTFTDGTKYKPWFGYYNEAAISAFKYENISNADLIVMTPDAMPDFTLREIQTAVFETLCQFGQLSRITDLFSGVELNHSRLYPADTLYPATNLYPDGAAVSGFKSMYSKLWADEGNVHKWRYLIITYKGLDEEQHEKDLTLQRTVNADGTDDYNMSDNWLFRNLVWTAEQVGDYADAMVAKMQDVTWFPFEMWCAGLPYIETGDEIEIPLNGESYTSYVLQRQLKGIQNLQDTYINGTLDIF